MGKKVTLNELMKDAKPGRNFFIGAASGFIFCGDIQAYRADFDAISEECTKALIAKEKVINRQIEHINELIKSENKVCEGEHIPEINGGLSITDKSLFDRKVIECYKKISQGTESGYAVIIRGSEYGDFWFKSEYDKKRKAKE